MSATRLRVLNRLLYQMDRWTILFHHPSSRTNFSSCRQQLVTRWVLIWRSWGNINTYNIIHNEIRSLFRTFFVEPNLMVFFFSSSWTLPPSSTSFTSTPALAFLAQPDLWDLNTHTLHFDNNRINLDECTLQVDYNGQAVRKNVFICIWILNNNLECIANTFSRSWTGSDLFF